MRQECARRIYDQKVQMGSRRRGKFHECRTGHLWKGRSAREARQDGDDAGGPPSLRRSATSSERTQSGTKKPRIIENGGPRSFSRTKSYMIFNTANGESSGETLSGRLTRSGALPVSRTPSASSLEHRFSVLRRYLTVESGERLRAVCWRDRCAKHCGFACAFS